MKLRDVPMTEQPPAMPAQAIAEEVLLEKYAKGDERTVDEVRSINLVPFVHGHGAPAAFQKR